MISFKPCRFHTTFREPRAPLRDSTLPAFPDSGAAGFLFTFSSLTLSSGRVSHCPGLPVSEPRDESEVTARGLEAVHCSEDSCHPKLAINAKPTTALFCFVVMTVTDTQHGNLMGKLCECACMHVHMCVFRSGQSER